MGKKSSPKAPDMRPYTEMSERLGNRALDQSARQQQWAEQMWTEQKAMLEKVLGPQLDIMKLQYESGMKDRQRYEQLYQPLEENLIKEFQSYDTPERRQERAGAAMAQVAASQKGAKDAARMRLESFGIDPSQTQSAALDRNLEAQEAAQQAAAGNMERSNVENTGRALRAEAINIGRGMPSQVAQSYGQSIAAGQTALGGMNQTVNTGANTMGTGQSWANQAMAANAQGANITSQGFQNKLAAYQAEGNPWELIAGIGGAWAGSGFRVGKNDGGVIAPEQMALPDQQTDTGYDSVSAELTPGEYVIPKEVVTFYGTDKLDKMVAKARAAQGIPENRGNAPAPKIEHPTNSRDVRPRYNTGGTAIPSGVPAYDRGEGMEIMPGAQAPTPDEPPQQGIDPSSMAAMAQAYQMGGSGSGAVAGSGSSAAGSSMGGAGASAGGAGSAAGGAGSAAAAAAPWVAAALAGHEYFTRQRNNDGTRLTNWDDFWSGNAGHKIANHYSGEMNMGALPLGDISQASANFAEGNFKKAGREAISAVKRPLTKLKDLFD